MLNSFDWLILVDMCFFYVKVQDKASSFYSSQNGNEKQNIWDKGRCTNEWLTFVTFLCFYNALLVYLSPSKIDSVKFSNWDLVLNYQLENICTINS